MTDARPRTKNELKQLFTNLANRGVTDDMAAILVDVLWREKPSLRSCGFFWPGGPDADISWSNTTRTFTISPRPADVGAEDADTYVPFFRFYSWGGKPVYQRRFDAETLVIPNEEGLFAIYYTANETTRTQELVYAKNPDEALIAQILTTQTLVAWVYWDATSGAALHFGDARHGSEWIPSMHLYLHQAFHARRNSGLSVSGMNINGDGSDNSHARFSIASGDIWHDDFLLAIPAAGGTNTIPVLYENVSSQPRFTQTSGYGIYNDGTRLCHNNWGTGITRATDEYFVMYHLFATNELINDAHKVISVMGMADYETIAAAYVNVNTELEAIFNYMPHQGRCYLGTVLLQTADAYTNSVHARVVGFVGDAEKMHPPVTIAPDSQDVLEINEDQELSFISPAPFEKDLDQGENDIDVGFILKSGSNIFRSGILLPSRAWTGVGTTILHLIAPGRRGEWIKAKQ
jgi:hypothetical protein